MTKKKLNIYLAEPRGFCAGVARAIQIVEKAIEKYGKPIYVRHEIVHNKFVVDSLRDKGAVFVDELDEIKDKSRPVIFSAHGVAKSVKEEAIAKGFEFIDAVCPLVKKVHKQAIKFDKDNIKTILIGKKNHVEVIGTKGQIDRDNIKIVKDAKDVELLDKSNEEMAYICQTTLSVDEIDETVRALKNKFTNLIEPKASDVCYATTNRQRAVKKIAKLSDLLIVIGSQNSSNSKKLREVAEKNGCSKAILIDDVSFLDFDEIDDSINNIGITAGASADEVVVQKLLDELKKRFDISVETVTEIKEDMIFTLPKELED